MVEPPIYSNRAHIKKTLFDHYEFEDCAIEELRWLNHGTCIELDLDYIWSDANGFSFENNKYETTSGTLREDLTIPDIKTLRFHGVQEFHVQNWWNDIIFELGPDEFGDALSEVSVLRIENHPLYLAKYGRSAEFHHLAILFHGDRRIDVVCIGISISPATAASPSG